MLSIAFTSPITPTVVSAGSSVEGAGQNDDHDHPKDTHEHVTSSTPASASAPAHQVAIQTKVTNIPKEQPAPTSVSIGPSPMYVTKDLEFLSYENVQEINDSVIFTSLAEVPLDQKQTPLERTISIDVISTVSSVNNRIATLPIPADVLQAWLQETVIYSFLGVKVNKGELLGKGEENHGKKTHQGYETVIRILSFDEILYPEKEKEMIDQDAYRQWLMQGSSSLSIKVNKVFDGYRNFKLNLEKQKVYCHDFIPAGTKIDIESVVLDASFPPTLKRSGWGLGLTPAQIDER
jgi:hypothetical protein